MGAGFLDHDPGDVLALLIPRFTRVALPKFPAVIGDVE